MVKLRGINSRLSKLKLTSGQKEFLAMQDHWNKGAAHKIKRFGKFILKNKTRKRGWKNPKHFKY